MNPKCSTFEETVPADHGTHPSRPAVLLMNLGTPEAPDTPAVRRYLTEFLGDPYVIKLPRGMKWFLPVLCRLIAFFRGPQSAKAYQTIWTDRGSPLKFLTEDQVISLKRHLPSGWDVFYSMRYGSPSTKEVLQEIEKAGITELTVVPMYPQHGGPTTGTALDELYELLRHHCREVQVRVFNTWYDDIGYLDAQARLIQEQASREKLCPSKTYLLFSAHSMPKSYIEAGDPYLDQINHSVDLILERLGWPRQNTGISFQSKLGPVPWLEPSTENHLKDLASKGVKQVLVCPISFAADCLETIEEIGGQYREQFEESGGRLFLCPSLNDYEPFMKALSKMVLRGRPRSAQPQDAPITPLLDSLRHELAPDARIDDLLMIGVSIRNRIGSGRGPSLTYVEPEDFPQYKRPQLALGEVLRSIQAEFGLAECWVWNTCNRFEFYTWSNVAEPGALERLAERVPDLIEHLFGADADTNRINILTGRDTWHHLLRTSCGINSPLPGDSAIAEQLAAAQRVASHAHTAGPLTQRLIHDVIEAHEDVRSQTPWGEFRHEYCETALGRIIDRIPVDLTNGRTTIIGGSTTSRGIIAALTDCFDVPHNRLTLIHRGHRQGRLIKLLRKAIGGGRRLRVEEYTQSDVLREIAESDVVFFGLDRREPVLTASTLAQVRNVSQRPITIVDFNTFGSTAGFESVEGVTLITAHDIEQELERFAEELLARNEFWAAADTAENWIAQKVHGSNGAPVPSHATAEPVGAGIRTNDRPSWTRDTNLFATSVAEGSES